MRRGRQLVQLDAGEVLDGPGARGGRPGGLGCGTAKDEEKRATVNQLRFDEGLGVYSVSVAPDSLMIAKGMGTHYI